MRRIMIGVGVLCATLAVAAILVPQGEVVTLHVTDVHGESHPTQLWIAEVDGTTYLRAGSPDALWLARLRDRNDVTLGGEHGTKAHAYRATPIEGDVVLRRRVGEAMAQKYGVADSLWALLSDRTRAVPIRLDEAEPMADRGASFHGQGGDARSGESSP